MSRTISVTEIGVFKRCRRMWDYSYNQHIVPIQEAPYFFAGRMVHQVLAEWMEDETKAVESLWAKTLARELEYYKQRYKDVIGAEPNQDEMDSVLVNADMPYHMVRNYREHWTRPLPEGFRLIQAEQTCIVDLPIAGVSLEGTLDGFVIDEKTGIIYVLERKTYEARPRIEVLDNNEQFVGYCYILRRLFPDYEIGGVLYDGLWKRQEPPRGKKLEDLFFRHLLPKSNEEIDNWEQQLLAVAQDMTAGEPLIYPNRTWQGCWDDSSYEKLCAAESKGDDYDYILGIYYGKKSVEAWRNYEAETI